MTASLPTDALTFLLTDVEGSTRLWEAHPAAMAAALARHDALVEAAIEGHDGVVVRPRGEGDSRFGVFDRAAAAVAAAAALQVALHAEPWPTGTPLRVRVALHTGAAYARAGDYYGPVVNRCARLRALARGGQVLLSGVTAGLVRGALPPGAALRDLGVHPLKDLAEPEAVFQLLHSALPTDFPPLRSPGRSAAPESAARRRAPRRPCRGRRGRQAPAALGVPHRWLVEHRSRSGGGVRGRGIPTPGPQGRESLVRRPGSPDTTMAALRPRSCSSSLR